MPLVGSRCKTSALQVFKVQVLLLHSFRFSFCHKSVSAFYDKVVCDKLAVSYGVHQKRVECAPLRRDNVADNGFIALNNAYSRITARVLYQTYTNKNVICRLFPKMSCQLQRRIQKNLENAKLMMTRMAMILGLQLQRVNRPVRNRQQSRYNNIKSQRKIRRIF